MKAKEISELNTIPLDDESLTLVYDNSNGTGKTTLANVRKYTGVNSLNAEVEELAPHSGPTASVTNTRTDYTLHLGVAKANSIESHKIEESIGENGLRKNTITDTFSDGVQKSYEVKDGIGIKNTEVEQNEQDSGISKITYTYTDGSTKEVEIHNGKGIESIKYTPSNLSKGENKFKVEYSDGTESKQFTILNGKDFRVVHSFKSEEERENSNFKWTDKNGEHEIETNDFVMIDTGSVEDEETGRLYMCAEENDEKVWHYIGDTSGCKGDTGTLEIGEVITVEPNEEANVENVGTPQSAILNFKIPKGDKGDPGVIHTIAGSYAMTVDDNGDLWLYVSDDTEPPAFELDEEKNLWLEIKD